MLIRTLSLCLLLPALVAAQQAPPAPRVTSPDQRYVVVGNGDRIDKIEAPSQKTLWRVTGFKGNVTAVAYSPDGKLVGAGTDGNQVSLYDAATGKEIRRMTAAAAVVTMTFSGDGRVVIAKLANQQEAKWEAATGKLLGQ
jgi:WD40 repeat protein